MPLSDDDKKEIASLITEQIGPTVNNMFTARLGTVEKKLAGQLTESITKGFDEKLGKTLEEKLSAFQPKPKDDDPDDKEPKDPKKRGEMAALKAQVQALQARNDEIDRERQALLARQRESALREGSAKVLNGAGIVGDKFEIAYAYLVQSGRVKLSDDPSSFEGLYSDPALGGDVPLDVGLGQWLKSDIAKTFLPPTGIRGSGGAPARSNSPNGQKPSASEQRQILGNRLVEEMFK